MSGIPIPQWRTTLSNDLLSICTAIFGLETTRNHQTEIRITTHGDKPWVVTVKFSGITVVKSAYHGHSVDMRLLERTDSSTTRATIMLDTYSSV